MFYSMFNPAAPGVQRKLDMNFAANTQTEHISFSHVSTRVLGDDADNPDSYELKYILSVAFPYIRLVYGSFSIYFYGEVVGPIEIPANADAVRQAIQNSHPYLGPDLVVTGGPFPSPIEVILTVPGHTPRSAILSFQKVFVARSSVVVHPDDKDLIGNDLKYLCPPADAPMPIHGEHTSTFPGPIVRDISFASPSYSEKQRKKFYAGGWRHAIFNDFTSYGDSYNPYYTYASYLSALPEYFKVSIKLSGYEGTYVLRRWSPIAKYESWHLLPSVAAAQDTHYIASWCSILEAESGRYIPTKTTFNVFPYFVTLHFGYQVIWSTQHIISDVMLAAGWYLLISEDYINSVNTYVLVPRNTFLYNIGSKKRATQPGTLNPIYGYNGEIGPAVINDLIEVPNIQLPASNPFFDRPPETIAHFAELDLAGTLFDVAYEITVRGNPSEKKRHPVSNFSNPDTAAAIVTGVYP